MRAESPFTITRFEYERRHLYFLPDALFSELENSIPTYLIGSRGTGKTTLLKALTWQERLHNQSLQAELNEEPFAGKYIGIYFKLPEIQLGLLDRWLEGSDDAIHGSILGLFFDLIWLELAVEAVAELVAEGRIVILPSQEHEFVDFLAENIPPLFAEGWEQKKGRGTLKLLARVLRERKRGLEIAALHRAHWPTVIEQYPLGQIGDLGRSIAPRLAALCDGNQKAEGGWRFMICMDEGECLNPFQQLVINTLVRLAEWPAFPIIASVSVPDDVTTTLVPELTLQKADRQLKILDEMGRAEFRELAEGVANVRIRSVTKDCVEPFDIQRILGPLNINRIVEELLHNSVRPGAKDLLKRATNFAEHPFFTQPQSDEATIKGSKSLPIYQAYLIDKLQISIADPDHPGWQRRRQDSAELRKRMVAAYLSICADFGLEVRYASGEMLLEMSDRCMRDFLSQIEEVYRVSGRSLSAFLKGDVAYSIQYSALRRASETKRDSIPKSGVRAPLQTGRVVDGLARITAALQKRGTDNRHLLSSERGIFVVAADAAAQQRFAADLALLADASDAGFLRVMYADEPTWEVRVHTSLAAAYGFSYRGAYYKCRLALEDVHRLANAQGRAALDGLVTEIGGKLGGQSLDDLPLFEGKSGG